MVKLEEVADEELNKVQQGPDDGEWESDDESDTQSIASSIGDETLYDRLAALQDMVPPKQRTLIANTYNAATEWSGRALTLGGKALWVLSTSVMLVALPWALAYGDDQMMAEEERRLSMQQTASEFLTAGGNDGEKSPAGL